MEASPLSLHAIRVLLVGQQRVESLRRAFQREGHHPALATVDNAIALVSDTTEAVVIAAPRKQALDLCARIKTRYQLPLLPVLLLLPRPSSAAQDSRGPDAWLRATSRSGEVIARVEELVRIRRAEREMVRLNEELAEVAGENGRLYDRARRDAEATALLLRELQHRVRNNLAAIQALLVLERHRDPPRALGEAMDVAVSRLRSMAALQDSLGSSGSDVDLATLAQSVGRGALDVFGATGNLFYEVQGTAALPSGTGSSLAIVLNELVTNAIKHAQASRIRVVIERGPDSLSVGVEDDGAGMPGTPGTGSGLLIARAVVRNELGGELAEESAEPGTRFRITIPASRSTAGRTGG